MIAFTLTAGWFAIAIVVGHVAAFLVMLLIDRHYCR
jgi:hypothetical protein